MVRAGELPSEITKAVWKLCILLEKMGDTKLIVHEASRYLVCGNVTAHLNTGEPRTAVFGGKPKTSRLMNSPSS